MKIKFFLNLALIGIFILVGNKSVIASTNTSNPFFNIIGASHDQAKSAVVTFGTAADVKCSISYLAVGGPITNVDSQAEGDSAHYSNMHIMGISGLEDDTKYYYSLLCHDQNNNSFFTDPLSSSGIGASGNPLPSFTTLPAGNQINNLSVIVSANYTSATISFNTDQPKGCLLSYSLVGGTTSNLNGLNESGLSTQHSIVINNLAKWHKYYYSITCHDSTESPYIQTSPLNSSGIDVYGNPIPSFSTVPTSGNVIQDVRVATNPYVGIEFNTISSVKCRLFSLQAGSRETEIGGDFESGYRDGSHAISLGFKPALKTSYYYLISCRDQNNNFYFSDPGVIITSASGVVTSASVNKSDKSFPGFKINSTRIAGVGTNLDISGMDATAKILFTGSVKDITAQLKESPNQFVEKTVATYIKKITPKTQKPSPVAAKAVNIFVSYGADENSKICGVNGRKSIVASFVAAFNRIPANEKDLSDVIKIANGLAPSQVSAKAENKAKTTFVKIYNRSAKVNNPNDQDAIKTLAYGLRQPSGERNLKLEAAGINNFKKIYRRLPVSAADWDTVTALTYSNVVK